MSSPRRLELVSPKGKVETIDRWWEYSFNDDMMGASNFSAVIPPSPANRALLKEVNGWRFRIFADDSLQFSGIIDETSHDTSTDSSDMHISGRDYRGLLMDSCIPYDRLSLYNRTLEEIARRWTVELWPDLIEGVVTDYASSRYIVAGGSKSTTRPEANQKTVGGVVTFTQPAAGKAEYKPFGRSSPVYAGTGNERIRQQRVEFGETPWNALTDLSSQIGCHCWMTCDGQVVLARPCYDFDHRAYGYGISLKWDAVNRKASGGNVRGVTYETSIAGRKSEYRVGAKGKSKKKSRAAELIIKGGVIKDPGRPFWELLDSAPWIGTNYLYKPGKIGAANVQDKKRLTRLARRTVIQNALAGFSLEYELNGHRSPGGAFWTTDSQVMVDDQRNGLQEVYYITKVERRFNATKGRTSLLTLWPTKLWLHDDDPSIPDDAWYEIVAPRIFW